MKPGKAPCTKCSALYWYDGYTWCPACDVQSAVDMARTGQAIPEAPDNVRKMRAANQERQQKESEG